MAEGLAEAVTIGLLFTVTLTVTEPVHPLLSVPVTVYTVEAVGHTFTVVPESGPGSHE
jgi:fatty acid desaturase